MKCWFLDETQEPEEKPLTAEQRRKPCNKLIQHNRELMQLQPSKTRSLMCSTVFSTFLLPSWDGYDVKFHFLWKKWTQVGHFLFLFLNWLEDGQSFWGMKQWMLVIGNGNFYPRQNRLFIYPFMLRIAVNNGRGKGLDLGAEPPRINICWVLPGELL